jgi:hypothetical protein
VRPTGSYGLQLGRVDQVVAGALSVSGSYEHALDATRTAWLTVRFETVRREVVAYAVVLSVDTNNARETVRVYDSAHGFNEVHRHTRRGGQLPGRPFHTLGEGMRTAIADRADGYGTMIEAWHR